MKAEHDVVPLDASRDQLFAESRGGVVRWNTGFLTPARNRGRSEADL
jgi:hypothetical protein